jgi:hypothetical protein
MMKKVMNGMIGSCRETAKLGAERLVRPLTALERIRMTFHLSMCGVCKAYSRQMQAMRRVLSRDDASLTREAEKRIVESIRKNS